MTKQGEDEAHTFTTADDAKLLELKAAGKTWKEIVAETKKSMSALKERFKEINPKAGGGAKNPTTVTQQGEDEAHTFTVADDAKLVEMKAAGKTWKEIVCETKKSMSALKERFKEIGPKSNGAAAGGTGGGAAEQGDKKKEKKAEAEAKAAAAAAAKDEKKEKEKDKSQKTSTVCKHCGKDANAPVEKEAKVSNYQPPFPWNLLKPPTSPSPQKRKSPSPESPTTSTSKNGPSSHPDTTTSPARG